MIQKCDVKHVHKLAATAAAAASEHLRSGFVHCPNDGTALSTAH